MLKTSRIKQRGLLFSYDVWSDCSLNIIPTLFGSKADDVRAMKKYQQLDFDTLVSGHNVVLEKSVVSKVLNLLEENDVYGS
ncbi:MAG: hypothetical protein N2376_04035 [Clostridia bacterium]|nr:hypothetical protein [Clostridia bacterium]